MSGVPSAPMLEVVICTYNNAARLDSVLSTLARQTSPGNRRWSCLVVDNNCTDETQQVVHRHAVTGGVPGLRSVREPQQGLTPARLRGVRDSTAPWMAFVDDDCLLRSNWVAQAIAFAEQHPRAGAFGGKVVLEWQVAPAPYVRAFDYVFAAQDHGSVQRRVEFLAGAGLVVSRSALAACGWIDAPLLADRIGTSLVSGGDVEIVLRIAQAGFELWYVPECELRHQIPAWRTTPRYLRAINRQLGASQTLADALVFEGVQSGWLQMAASKAARQLREILGLALAGARGSKPLIYCSIAASFKLGQLQGVWRILRMPGSNRRRLIGLASRRCSRDVDGNRAP